MKLYLVAPRVPSGIALSAKADGGALHIEAQLKNLKLPWPVTLAVRGPNGNELHLLWRSTGKEGKLVERIPLGSNATPGAYLIRIESPVGNLASEAKAEFKPTSRAPAVVTEAVRVFDGDATKSFLNTKPSLVIAVGVPGQKKLAENLARNLAATGFKVTVADEKQILRRVRYPRIWNPYAHLYKPTGEEKTVTNTQHQIELQIDRDGRVLAKTADGKDLGPDWRKPNTLATIVGDGYVDWSGDNERCYEAGCKLFVDEKNNVQVLKGTPTNEKTTPEFRARWSRPWASLTSYVGGYQLPAQLPEAYAVDSHLILLGDSTRSELVAALQASELLLQVVDEKYPGPGKALVSFAWSPFAVEKNVIFIGATDGPGLEAGASKLMELAGKR
jgi:hypothetical protein